MGSGVALHPPRGDARRRERRVDHSPYYNRTTLTYTMLSVSAISTGVQRVAAMMSPIKNPCRIRVASVSSEATSAPASWYRYDPYVCKVLPSPMKTTLQSPVKCSSPMTEVQTPHMNSLFAAAPSKPRSFLAAAESYTAAATAPAPIAASTTKRAANESAKTHYAIIQFKHETATFVAPFRVVPGDHVVVEGDRGEDVGRILEITTVTPAYPVPLKIVRRASPRDVDALTVKRQKEAETAVNVQKLADSLGLRMEVVDTEFQFDYNKLTVFFYSEQGHTDFRKLQRGLFREHHCRIWLSNMDEVLQTQEMQKVRRTK